MLTGPPGLSTKLLTPLLNFLVYGRGEQTFPPGCWQDWGLCHKVTKLTLPLSSRPVLPSLGLTILEVACNMELPHGGEGWQQLRQGYLPPEFTAGEWEFSRRAGRLSPAAGKGWRVVGGTVGLRAQSVPWPDMALPHRQVCLLSCVLSSP